MALTIGSFTSSALTHPLLPADIPTAVKWEVCDEQMLSMQDEQIAHTRGRVFIKKLESEKPLKAFLNRIFKLPDTEENRPLFEKIVNACRKEKGYFMRLFSQESWEEWTENRTALGKVASQFRDCVQSHTRVRNFIKKLDGRVLQKANEEAKDLLKRLGSCNRIPEESFKSYRNLFESSCAKGLVTGTVGSLATKNPLPFLLGLSECLPQASAQQKIGNEFRVNTYTTGDQDWPSLVNLNNNFVITWPSFGQDGSGWGVYGQLFERSGARIGSEFQVNTYTANNQSGGVAPLRNGNFIALWSSEGQDGSGLGAYSQLFDESGPKIGSELQVNNYTANNQFPSSVASLNNGNFIALWSSEGQDGSGYGIFGQLFDENNIKIGSEFQINTYTINDQQSALVESLSNGNFVAAWTSDGQDGSGLGVYGQLFDENSTQIGNEFQINTYTVNDQRLALLKSLSNGNFVATWTSDGQDGSGSGLYGQLFNENSTKIGGEFQINTYTINDQMGPHIADLGNGNFVVIWNSYIHVQDGNDWGLYGQLFDGNGTKIGSEFQINTHTNGPQWNPKISSFINGNFVVAWGSLWQDGSQWGVYGQLFDGNSTKIGSEFQVNTFTIDAQVDPGVTTLDNNDFVVIWRSLGQDGSGWGVYGQIFHDNITIPLTTGTTGSTGTTGTSGTTRFQVVTSSSTGTTASRSTFGTTGFQVVTSSSTGTTASRSTSGISTNAITSFFSSTGISGTTAPRIILATTANSEITSSGSSPSLVWLWVLLGVGGSTICIGVTGYAFYRRRFRLDEQIELGTIEGSRSKSPEEVEYPNVFGVHGNEEDVFHHDESDYANLPDKKQLSDYANLPDKSSDYANLS